ncbi:MAG: hypothetical protein ACJAUP_001415 [Cellvibrionaceae bacterium]
MITFEVTTRAISGADVGLPMVSSGLITGPAPVVYSIRYHDINRSAGADGYIGDQLVIAFDTAIIVTQQDADIFSFPVSGGSLDSYSFAAGPLGNEITVTFESGSGPRNLRLVGLFNSNELAAGSPSGFRRY